MRPPPTPEPRVACGTRERDRGGAWQHPKDHATLQRRTPGSSNRN